MRTDIAELVGLLGRVSDRSGHPALTSEEPKATLAVLAALHAPDTFAVEAAPVAAGRVPVPAGGRDAMYYGHPDGGVERVDESGSRRLRPARQWSPDGFAWGYRGDSPTELAHALLADSTGSSDVARRLAVRYGSEVIAALPQGQAWSLPVRTVAAWVTGAEQQRPPIVTSARSTHSTGRDAEAGL